MMIRDSRGGGSGSVALIMVLPILMLLVFGSMQLAVHHSGNRAAIAAAQAAAEAERVLLPTPGAGQQVAHSIATQAGLTNVRVNIDRSPTTVRVTVTGDAPVLVKLGTAEQVRAVIVAPKERIS